MDNERLGIKYNSETTAIGGGSDASDNGKTTDCGGRDDSSDDAGDGELLAPVDSCATSICPPVIAQPSQETEGPYERNSIGGGNTVEYDHASPLPVARLAATSQRPRQAANLRQRAAPTAGTFEEGALSVQYRGG
jgi:hypothetical protein